ncbi:MAG: hypothetical protein A2V66_06805 [Ignavibacteria bacterium RBG_13_36_8]|nr:MAG: hypothetical protein A2V66_06805 [Ignavibacteria bacterium RBG_13_36_8]
MKKLAFVLLFGLFLINNSCTKEGSNPSENNDTSTITYESKTYHIVQIGNQSWLKENLDVGTIIQGNENPSNNGTIEKYCYNNDPNNCTTYGGLYQWDEAMAYSTTPGAQGICPRGWHVPTLSEFETLQATINNDGNALKAVGQGSGNGTGSNISEFSALLAGYRGSSDGFYYLGDLTYFWSSTENINYNADNLYLDSWDDYIGFDTYYKDRGFSVRCVKD